MAADRGMMFCASGKENGSGFTVLPALYQHPLHTLLPSVSPCLLLPQLKLDHVLVGGQDKDGRKQLCIGLHLAREKRSGVRDGGLEALWTLHGPNFIEPHLGTGDPQ